MNGHAADVYRHLAEDVSEDRLWLRRELEHERDRRHAAERAARELVRRLAKYEPVVSWEDEVNGHKRIKPRTDPD